MDVTATSPTDLITCAGCGAHVPFTESFYVDGAGQLCTATCAAPCRSGLSPSSRPSDDQGRVPGLRPVRRPVGPQASAVLRRVERRARTAF